MGSGVYDLNFCFFNRCSDVCGVTVKKTTLYTHKERKHGKEQLPCKLCGKIFRHKRYLELHIKACAKLDRYTCDICGFVGNKDHLRYHTLAKHTPEHLRPFQCHMCTRGFALKKHLEDHINVHTGNKPYECKYCGMKFASDGNMNGHIRQTHKGIKRNTSKS